MGLNFSQTRNIQFGDIVANIPVLGQKDKLKLQQLDFGSEAKREEAIDAMSSIFKEKNEEIRKFMLENMTDFDLARAQAYIIGGQSMLEAVDKQFEKEMEKAIAGGNNE